MTTSEVLIDSARCPCDWRPLSTITGYQRWVTEEACSRSRSTPMQLIQNQTLFDLVFATKVKDPEKLRTAGNLLRTWANSLFKQYFKASSIFGDVDESDLPQLPLPNVESNADSDLFTIGLTDIPGFEISVADNDSDGDESFFGSGFHWRLSDELLILGTSPDSNRRTAIA